MKNNAASLTDSFLNWFTLPAGCPFIRLLAAAATSVCSAGVMGAFAALQSTMAKSMK